MREIATRNTNATQNPSRSMALAPMGPLYVQHTTHTTRYPTRFGFTCVCKAYDTCGLQAMRGVQIQTQSDPID